MITFDRLCRLAAERSALTVPLRQACALPRSPVDETPLPVPGAEFVFDSSWEAIFSEIDMADEPGALGYSQQRLLPLDGT